MNTFSSCDYENFSEKPLLYPLEAEFRKTSPYTTIDPKLQDALFENQFDCLSDVSVDTSSAFSFDCPEYLNYMMQGNQSYYYHPEVSSLNESLKQYGSRTFTHSESPEGSRYSDAEMSEFLPFDQGLPRNPRINIEEEEERLYLTELVHHDIVAADYARFCPNTMEIPHWNIEPKLSDFSEDVCPITTSMYKKLQERNQLKKEIYNELQQRDQLKRERLRCNGQKQNLYFCNESLRHHPKPKPIVKAHHLRHQPEPKPTVVAHQLKRKNKEKYSHEHKDGDVRSTAILGAEKTTHVSLVSKKKNKNKQLKPTNNDDQRVFLGGLPVGMTERMLRQHLAAQGYKVLKRPKILHGFAPEVWMRTVDQAKDLIERGVVTIGGMEVEVRPYNSLTKLSELKKLPNVGKRSVFIGGLSVGTTTKNIQDVLMGLGLKVINYPVIKRGFARQVILENMSQAKTLIKLKQIEINGTLVDVRPFVNQKRWRISK